MSSGLWATHGEVFSVTKADIWQGNLDPQTSWYDAPVLSTALCITLSSKHTKHHNMSSFNIYTVSSQVCVFPHVYLPHSLSGGNATDEKPHTNIMKRHIKLWCL